MRIVAATDLKTRTDAPDRDARMTNCYVEIKGQESIVRKRPGLIDLTSSVVGIGQGGVQTDAGAVFFTGDQITTAAAITQNYTIASTDIAVNACGNVVVNAPASATQSIAVTNTCNGNVTIGGVVARTLVIVGVSIDALGNNLAFLWTESGGMSSLGTLGGGATSYAYGVSLDGGVVVGLAYDATFKANAFRWTSGGGMVSIGSLFGLDTVAYGVSGDGITIVGYSVDPSGFPYAFSWTSAGGMVSIGTLGGTFSKANSVSHDGAVIVGNSRNISGNLLAFRWTSGGGMVSLGTLGGATSDATGVSSDGLTVVGYSLDISGNTYAFRWESGGGMVSIGSLGGTYSKAYGVSADGTVIFGESTDANGDLFAFIWTLSGGMSAIGGIGSSSRASVADGSMVSGYSLDITFAAKAFYWNSGGGLTNIGTLGGATSYAYGVAYSETPITVPVIPQQTALIAPTGTTFVGRTVTTYLIGLAQVGNSVWYNYFYISAANKIEYVGNNQLISSNLFAGLSSTSTTVLVDNAASAASRIFTISSAQAGSVMYLQYVSGTRVTQTITCDVNLFALVPSSITAISL